jgi:hypothetical protein
MIEPGFLEQLARSPETALAQYELDDSERAAVLQAAERLAATPPTHRARVFRSAMVRRVAT